MNEKIIHLRYNFMKKTYFIILFFILVSLTFSKTTNYNWERFSGIWTINNSIVNETRGGAITWNYYDLLNYNTIISMESFLNYSSISIDANIIEKLQSPSEFMISFAVTSESKSWYYKIYAFKVTAGFWGINKISFIHSDRKDKTKPFTVKNNTFSKELASAKCSIKYDKMYNYRIVFENENVVFYLDDKAILSYKFPEKSHEGRIAISSRNVKLAIDKVEIKKNDKILFEDHFDKDSILVKRLKATKESIPETEADIKPE